MAGTRPTAPLSRCPSDSPIQPPAPSLRPGFITGFITGFMETSYPRRTVLTASRRRPSEAQCNLGVPSSQGDTRGISSRPSLSPHNGNCPPTCNSPCSVTVSIPVSGTTPQELRNRVVPRCEDPWCQRACRGVGHHGPPRPPPEAAAAAFESRPQGAQHGGRVRRPEPTGILTPPGPPPRASHPARAQRC